MVSASSGSGSPVSVVLATSSGRALVDIRESLIHHAIVAHTSNVAAAAVPAEMPLQRHALRRAMSA